MDSSNTTFHKANNFECFWKPFIRVFQVLCISNYSIYRPNLKRNSLKSFAFLTYFIIFGGIHIGITVYALKRSLRMELTRNDKYKESPLMYYVSWLSIFGDILAHLTSNLVALLKGKQEAEIYQKIEEIDEIFFTKLKHSLNYNQMRRKYVYQTFGIFILSTVLSIISTLTPLPMDRNYFVCPILMFAILVIRGRGCQIALVLHTLCHILMDLKILLKQQQLNCHRGSSGFYSIENIQYYRKIYSKIWLIKTLMSDCFGLTFITFLVQFTFDLIDSSYWAYINLSLYESKLMSIRKKYFFCGERCYNSKIQYIFQFYFVSDISFYIAPIVIVFCYICMLSERCQQLVCVQLFNKVM